MTIAHVERKEDAPSFLEHTPPWQRKFGCMRHFLLKPILNVLMHSMCYRSDISHIRINGRYGIFSSAGQHGSLGAGVSFHHEALRDALTDFYRFRTVCAFVLHLETFLLEDIFLHKQKCAFKKKKRKKSNRQKHDYHWQRALTNVVTRLSTTKASIVSRWGSNCLLWVTKGNVSKRLCWSLIRTFKRQKGETI